MYRKPRFLKVLHAIREQMSREVDYDVDLFAEMVRATAPAANGSGHAVRLHKNGKGRSAAKTVSAKAQHQNKSRKRAAK